MGDWQRFLKESDAEMRRNDLSRGLGWSADPKASTISLVEDYVTTFGWTGIGATQVVAAVQRDERGVKRALSALVQEGTLRLTLSDTRGPKASKRKVYWPAVDTGPMLVSTPMLHDGTPAHEFYGTAPPVKRKTSERTLD